MRELNGASRIRASAPKHSGYGCPNCGARGVSRVIDSRWVEPIQSIRRRRKCLSCSTSWTTYEVTKESLVTTGAREHRFEKLMSSLVKALSDNGYHVSPPQNLLNE